MVSKFDIRSAADLEKLFDISRDFIEFYRKDPVIAAYDLLKVDLAPIQRVVLRDMWEKNFVIGVMGRGAGKSQSTDSMSFTGSGGLNYLYEEFDKIPSFLEDNQTIELPHSGEIYTSDGFKPIKRISLEKNITGIRLTTKLGLENKGSVHHPLLTVDNYGNFYYKKLEDFKVGDYVCIQRGQNSFGETSIPSEDAYLLGLFIGDGSISDKYSFVSITTADKQILDFCEAYCSKYNVDCIINFDKRTVDTYKIVFKNFSWFFDKYSVKRCLSYFKEVPHIVRNSDKITQSAFLRGLFDADGGVEDKRTVGFCSASEKLVKELQIMLLNLGIISIKTKKITRSAFGKAFLLYMYGENAYLFKDIIGFALQRKQSVLERYFSDSHVFNTNKNIIPYIKDTIVKDLACKYKSVRSFGDKVLGKRYRFENSHNLSYSMLSKIVDCVDLSKLDIDIYEKLCRIRNRNYYYDVVTSIEDWQGDCYDFEMDMDIEPNYFSNGFICHNTFMLAVNAVLHCLLYPGYRVGLLGPSFRQSKYIFAEVEKLYSRSSILREACEKKPTRGSDACFLRFKSTDNSSGSYIEAMPIGVDGAKIRGSRFYLIEIDELAQMLPSIIDLVIRPMGAVSLEPMQRVRERERQEELIKRGLATEDDFSDFATNKMIMTSSGYFKFNHMWQRMKTYWRNMEDPELKDKYSVHQVPYTLLPPAFLDEDNIKAAKRDMSKIEFMMEYEAAMVSDSDGFFKASLLDECTMNSGFTIKLKGDPDREYVMGVDPNQGGNAACGVVIIEIGKSNKIVYVKEVKESTTQKRVEFIQHLVNKFNISRIYMDSQGGGSAFKDLLESGHNNQEPILDVEDKLNFNKSGKHILRLVNPTTNWIQEANFATLAMFENRELKFPELPLNSNAQAEKLYVEVRTLKSQLLNIVVSQTLRGVLHFDTPKKGQNKDLYSAIVLAAWGARDIVKENEAPIKEVFTGGYMRPRRQGSQFERIVGAVNSDYTKEATLPPKSK